MSHLAPRHVVMGQGDHGTGAGLYQRGESKRGGRSPDIGARFSGVWAADARVFGALPAFLPHWPADELVAAYATVGAVPAYLQWLQPERGFVGNLRDVILPPSSLFLSEPSLLLSDELRDPRVHRTIVRAIGRGAHTLGEISAASFVSKTHLPATVHQSDPFFRFCFRFLAPMQGGLN